MKRRLFATSVNSLENKLQRQLFLGLSVVLILVLVILHLSVQQLTTRFVASRLQHDAESLVAALQPSNSGDWQMDTTRLASIYERPFSGHYYRVQIGQTSIRSRSLWDLPLPQDLTAPAQGHRTGHLDGPDGQEWITLSQSFQRSGQSLQVWIAEDLRPLRTLQLRFELGVSLLVASSIPVLLYLQKLIIARQFGVFDELHAALRAIHEGRALKFPEDLPVEVADLVAEIERTLLRSATQLQRSRTAVGNLAHELKRPLHSLRWLAEHHEQVPKQELLPLYQQLQNLVTRELRRAAISGSPSPGKRFHPKEDLPVLETLLRRQYSKEIALSLELPDGSLPYDRDDMLELIGNLLDNAWRFARTRVTLHIHRQEDNNVALTIEDDGPGLTNEDCQLLSQRGVSRDEACDQHQGLGLHICQAVVDSYGGTMTLQTERAGLKICVTLPA